MTRIQTDTTAFWLQKTYWKRSLNHGNLRGGLPTPRNFQAFLGMMVSKHQNCYEVQFLFGRLSPALKQLPTLYKAKRVLFWDGNDGIFPGGWIFSDHQKWAPKNGIFVSDFVNLATKFRAMILISCRKNIRMTYGWSDRRCVVLTKNEAWSATSPRCFSKMWLYW